MAEMTEQEKKDWLAANEKTQNSGLMGVFKRIAEATNAKAAKEKSAAEGKTRLTTQDKKY
jgi:outer membrane murein-binding lipoprotein Lpp